MYNKLYWFQEQVLFFELISKVYESKGSHFIVCLCEMTLSKILECWLCKNVNLVLLWISRILEITRWLTMTVFFWENYWIKEVWKGYFSANQTLLPAKVGQNNGVTVPLLQPLVATGKLQCDLYQHEKWLVKQKGLISTPVKNKDSQQITFVMLNRLCPLSRTPPPHAPPTNPLCSY